MAHSSSRSSPPACFGLIVLGVGSFAIVTAELAPIGSPSLITSDLGVSTATARLAVTLYV